MKEETTTSIYQAIGVNLVFRAVVLIFGVMTGARGIQMEAVALTIAMLAELGFLDKRTRRTMPELMASR
jgi:hypothetical protein